MNTTRQWYVAECVMCMLHVKREISFLQSKTYFLNVVGVLSASYNMFYMLLVSMSLWLDWEILLCELHCIRLSLFILLSIFSLLVVLNSNQYGLI